MLKSAHKKRFFFLKSILLGCIIMSHSFIAAQPSIEKSRISKLVNDTVSNFIVDNNHKIWAIVGQNQEKVVLIDKQQSVREIPFENSYQNLNFTTLFPLPNGAILAGTKSHYLFYICGENCIQIDKTNGLEDSSVLQISCNQNTKELECTTSGNKYYIKNSTSARRLKCEVIKENHKNKSTYYRQKIRKPVQKFISHWASETDVSFRKTKYINQNERDSIIKLLQPGDIFVKRDDHFISNIGIKGFWKHSAIYLGSLELLDSNFSGLPMLNHSKPSEYILAHFPLVYEKMKGQKNMILEAIGKGVTINTIEHIVFVDYVTGLRPNLSKNDVFKSLLIGFEYLNFPYDFLFDFFDDSELVCSELIYNMYRPRSDKAGVTFLYSKVMGHPFSSPTDIAHKFANDLNTPNPSFSFVFFCDYDKKAKKPFFNTQEAFTKSWNR